MGTTNTDESNLVVIPNELNTKSLNIKLDPWMRAEKRYI